MGITPVGMGITPVGMGIIPIPIYIVPIPTTYEIFCPIHMHISTFRASVNSPSDIYCTFHIRLISATRRMNTQVPATSFMKMR